MKHLLRFSPIIAALGISSAAFAAAKIDGIYNTTLGYLAGVDADGGRTTAVGAGAAGEATGLSRDAFVGSAAGMRAHGIQNCVAIGHGAMAGASNCTDCVAVGPNAMANETGKRGVLDLNGQFRANATENEFWIKASPGQPNAEAPIHFVDGTLFLNVANIVASNALIGALAEASSSVPVCDFYVSQAKGYDGNDGRSVAFPFKTVDAAVAACTSNGQSICVLAGRYPFPADYCAKDGRHSLAFVAPQGADATVFDASLNAVSNATVWAPEGILTSFDGFSFEGATMPFSRPEAYGAFVLCYFRNCRFSGKDQINRYARPYFSNCVLENCTADLHLWCAESMWGSPNPNNLIFGWCLLSGCIMEIATTNDVTNSGAWPNFGRWNRIENCFIECGTLYVGPSGSLRAFGSISCVTNSTFVSGPWIEGTKSVGAARGLFNSLLGVGDGSPIDYADASCVVTNAAALKEALGFSRRPSEPAAWRLKGYGSAYDRDLLESFGVTLGSE